MSNINVNNITPLSGNTGTVSVSGSLLVSGSITANGNIILGDSIGDSVSLGAEISSSIIPDANNKYDLGSLAKKWKKIHATTGSFDNISGSVTFGNNITISNNTITATSGTFSYLSGSSPITVAGAMIPDIDDTHDLGSSTKKFKDLYVDGVGYIDQVGQLTLPAQKIYSYTGSFTNLSVGSTFNPGRGISSSLIPVTHDRYDLGASNFRYKDIYTSGNSKFGTNWTDNHHFQGNITSSGHISASSHIIALGDATLGRAWANTHTIRGKHTTIHSDITCSKYPGASWGGNISASGHIKGLFGEFQNYVGVPSESSVQLNIGGADGDYIYKSEPYGNVGVNNEHAGTVGGHLAFYAPKSSIRFAYSPNDVAGPINGVSQSFATSASLSAIRFQNLPTTLGQARAIGTGSLWLSGSAGNASKFLVVFTGE